jgi:hypothetical protein
MSRLGPDSAGSARPFLMVVLSEFSDGNLQRNFHMRFGVGAIRDTPVPSTDVISGDLVRLIS